MKPVRRTTLLGEIRIVNTQAITFSARENTCAICGSSDIKPEWLVKKSDRVPYLIDYCRQCHSAFMNPRPIPEFLQSAIYSTNGHGLAEPPSLEKILAAELEYPNATIDAKTMVHIAAKLLNGHMTAKKKALDIGSGYGFYSKAAMEAGFEVTAVNPGLWENHIYRQITGLEPIVDTFEACSFPFTFDLVILSQVLEHLYSPERVIRKIYDVLTPGGILAVAVPNIDWLLVKLLKERENGVLWVPEHLNYFSRDGLKLLLTNSGLRVLETRNVARVPSHALSRRLKLHGNTRHMVNRCVALAQWAPMRICESFGMGIALQIWATKDS